MLAILITLAVIFTMSIAMAQGVKADDPPVLITNAKIYVNNPNNVNDRMLEVSFELGELIDLSDEYSNIIYEYFIDDEVIYTKNKSWGGYLNSYDDYPYEHTQYSTGSDEPTLSDAVPATKIYTSIKKNSTISDVKNVTAVKVTVLRADGSGETVTITCDDIPAAGAGVYYSTDVTHKFISIEPTPPTTGGTLGDSVSVDKTTVASLRDMFVTEEDLALGNIIELKLTVDEVAGVENLQPAQQIALQSELNKLGANQVGLVLEISLDKYVNGVGEQISNIPGDNKITLVIDIPADMQDPSRDFSVIHIKKDGSAETLKDEDTNPATITISVSSFSPFVLVSVPKPIITDNSGMLYWIYINQLLANQRETPKVTLDANLTYTGKAQTPTPVVKSGITTLRENTDYTLTYSNNINAGTASVEVKFKGDYSQFNTQTVEFKIKPAALKAALIDETITLGETPALKIEVTGFVNNETAATAKGYAKPKINVYIPEKEGTFKVTPAEGKADNYIFEYVTGYVTVKAPPHGTCYYATYIDLGSKYESSHSAIDYVIGKGYFKGISGNEFSPEGAMTRAMIPTVLGRIAGINETSVNDCGFSDVDAVKFSWATAAIKWGQTNGIVKGTDTANNKFSPEDNVTIEQAVTFIYRYLKSTGTNVTLKGSYDISKYNISEYAAEAMTWAYANSMISETELAGANKSASRILLAEMLYAIRDIIG